MRSTHFLLAALIIGVATLTACGGGGGGGPVAPPPVDPIDPTDPVDPADPPGPQRGSSAVPGIDQIPIDRITVPNSQMKDMFAIQERTNFGNNRHTRSVRRIACNSYTIQCDDSESYHGKHRNVDGTVTTMTGSAPYSSITDNLPGVDVPPDEITRPWVNAQTDSMPNLKILSVSKAIDGGRIGQGTTLPSYLVVQGAGNQGVGQDNDVLDSTLPTTPPRVKRAIAENKMLLVAGWSKDANGNYTRHAQSVRCRESGVSEGCLWAQFDFPGIGLGTSLSAPQVTSALASVLSVFPHTTHQNLAKFAKACARKTGNGIPVLLARYGGVGVADFTCMGSVTAALANLPTGGRTNVAVNGQTVSVSRNQIILSLSSASATLNLLRQEEREDGFSYSFIPTGSGGLSAVLLQKRGDSFASASFGTKDDFFGFYDGHHNVFAAELAAGYDNAFIRFSQERSSGDGADIRDAEGRAVGVTLRREFALSENTTLTTEGHADRFLGGSALISFGELTLPEGAWQYRLNLKTETEINEHSDLSFSASSLLPPSGEREDAAMARYRLRF